MSPTLFPKSTNLFIYFAVFSVSLLSFNTSPGFSWPSPSIPKLLSNDTNINPLGRPITTFQESFIVSVYSFTSIFGSMFAGFVSDQFGRKITLIILSLPFFVCYFALANATLIYQFFVTRGLLGVSAGGVMALVPSYIAEIASDHNRGSLTLISIIFAGLGHVLVFVLGPLVSIQTFAYVLMCPVTLFFLTYIPFVPESPHFLMANGEEERAEECLQTLRSKPNVSDELIELKKFLADASESKKNYWEDLKTSRATQNGLIISCALMSLQPLMGIPFVSLYLQIIIESSGTTFSPNVVSIIVGVVPILSIVLSMFLIDQIGRKFLLVLSSVGSFFSLMALGVYFLLKENGSDVSSLYWVPFFGVVNYYVFYTLGFSGVPFTIAGELFNVNVKSFCISLSTGLHQILWAGVAFAAPYFVVTFGLAPAFFLFAGFAMFSIFFVIFFVIETNKKSFQQIQDELDTDYEKIKYESLSSVFL